MSSDTGASNSQSRSKILIISLLTVLVLSTTVLAVLYTMSAGTVARQQRERDELVAENKRLQDTVAMDIASQKADAEAPKSTYDLIAVYNQLLEQSVNATDGDRAAVLEAVAEYYHMDQLPADASVLAVYQMVKPDTPPSGDLYALVYWPASEQKPAGFMDVIKAAGSDQWKYHEAL